MASKSAPPRRRPRLVPYPGIAVSAFEVVVNGLMQDRGNRDLNAILKDLLAQMAWKTSPTKRIIRSLNWMTSL